jgi:hypothetical protein
VLGDSLLYIALCAFGAPLSALVLLPGVIGHLVYSVLWCSLSGFRLFLKIAFFLAVWFGLIQKKIVFKN